VNKNNLVNIIPKISVVIPVYNTAYYLTQCIESVINQTLKNIEIICVDNGSTDGSYELLLKYCKSNNNISVIRHIEGKQGGARNTGIEMARGKYIGFVDSDDFVASTMFEELYNAAQESHAEMAVCNIQFYYDNYLHGSYSIQDTLLEDKKPFTIQQRPKLLRNLTICNKLFARQFVNDYRIRFPTGIFHEDQVFVISAYILAHRIVSFPEALYFYRRERPGSVNLNSGPENLHIFIVMRIVNELINNAKLNQSLTLLINEVKALKYLQLYPMKGKSFRRKYYSEMRAELLDLSLHDPNLILSRTERREFQFVLSHGYELYNVYLLMRKIYGNSREFFKRYIARTKIFQRPILIGRGT
jgi:glycosyltransferase involved in cell wall biosynthesis